MLRKQKEIVVESLVDDLKAHDVAYLVDYKGLNVEQITVLRRKLREDGAKLRVVKNTLLRHARSELGKPQLSPELFTGSTAIIFSADDPVSPAKTVKEFLKNHSKPEVKIILVDEVLYGAEKYEEFASLPSIFELKTRVTRAIGSPLYGLVYVLNGLISGLANQLHQIKNNKENA